MPDARISDCRIHYHVTQGVAVVRPEGPLHERAAEALARLVTSSLIESRHLIIDFSRTKYIETPGYRWLVRRFRELEGTGKTMIVAGLPPSIERNFKLLHLDRMVPAARNVHDAMRSMRAVREPAVA